MAWTNIPDDVLEPNKPIRSVDAIALRDNPIAIAQGLPGAPRVTDAGLSETATNTGRDWVLNRTALAQVGAVGTYAWLGETTTTKTNPGGTRAGSGLRYASAVGITTFNDAAVGVGAHQGSTMAPAGTWRCMGLSHGDTGGGGRFGLSLWLRIS